MLDRMTYAGPVTVDMPPFYLGIDGGGTVLRVVLADAELTVYGRAEGPGANPSLVGRERAAAIVRETVLAALGPLPADSIAAVAIGLAGAAASHSRAWLLEVVHALLPQARVVPSADYEIALVGALGRRQGVIVLAGTGALAYGVNAAGESALAGGWGYLLGDEGGGYWLGREGLRAVLRSADGRGPATALSSTLLPALGLANARDLVPWLYGDAASRDTASRIAGIAALAPLVLEAAVAADGCAMDIVERGAHELERAVDAITERLEYADAPIAFAGGLLSAPNPLSTALCTRLGIGRLPGALYPPVMGAVILARDTANVAAAQETSRRLASSEPASVTEASNPRTAAIDRCDTLDVLGLLNAEEAIVADVVRAALPQLALAVEAIVAGMRQGGRLIYVGAGTSGRLGVLDAAECPPTFGVLPEQVIGLIAGGEDALTRAVEGAEDDREAGRRDLLALGPGPLDVVVGLAASGRTPYVLAALEAAREAGARTVGIACNAPSPVLEAADIPIPLVVGPEALTGSTRLKAGTATKMALNLLSTASMVRLGKVYGNLMVDVRVANDKLAERAVRIVGQVTGADATQARILLEGTGWRVKPAIVMAVLGVPLGEAEQRLAEAGGLLSQVIGPAQDRRGTQGP